MKQFIFWFCLVVVVIAVLVGTSPVARADVYASALRVTQIDSDAPFDGSFADGTGARIHFVLNDHADNVIVMIELQGQILRSFSLSDVSAGEHSIVWDGTTNYGYAAPAGSYTFRVYAQSSGYSSWTMFYDSGEASIYTRGVDVNNDPYSPDFGYMYAGNNGGPLGLGILRYRADGAPAGDSAKPLIQSTASYPWGSQNVFHATIDYLGRVYVSGLNTNNNVVRYDPRDGSLKQVVGGLTNPRGLAAVGEGVGFKLYIATSTSVVVAKLGLSDTLSVPLDTVANLGVFVQDLVIDDLGFMYVLLRSGTTGELGAIPGWLEKYWVGGRVPVTRADSIWSVVWSASRPAEIAMYHGANRSSNKDDRLYVSVSGTGTENGVYEIERFAFDQPKAVKIFDPPLGQISSRAGLTVDAVGNVILFENNNEHYYFISPPNGYNYYITLSPRGVAINVTTPGKAAPVLSIAEARVDTSPADGKPDRMNQVVTVFGVVTSPNFLLSSNAFSYYIQDATAGIDVYAPGTIVPFLNVGDSIRVTGKITQFRGLTEIQVANTLTDIVVIASGRSLPAPKVVTVGSLLANAEAYEGQLVTIKRVRKASTSVAWPAPGNDANMTIYDDATGPGTTLTMRIDKDMPCDSIAEPTWPQDVTGIVSQFTSGASVVTGGYQILPRFASDFVPSTGTTQGSVTAEAQSAKQETKPDGYALEQNYPNPFNPSTTIRFGLPEAGHVKLTVYNILGEEVATLIDGYREAGWYSVNFDASRLASGTYIYLLNANGHILKGKMLLIK